MVKITTGYLQISSHGRARKQQYSQKQEQWVRSQDSNLGLSPTKTICYHYTTPQSNQSSKDN